MTPFDPSEPLSAPFRAAVSAELTNFIASQRLAYGELAESVSEIFEQATAFTSGGKRFRPGFCYWSFAASSDAAPTPPVLTAAASLDLLHVSALVHDDLMDASDTRRGIPAAHRQFSSLHAARSGVGSGTAFGASGAILLGDLLLTWSAEMFDTAGLSDQAIGSGLPHLHAMRTEVALGQYLDVRTQAILPADAVDQLNAATQITEYKTASYSVKRPCQLGAAMAGGSPALVSAMAKFGSPLGRAYQLRDDLLGIYGDPAETGKPAGDDLGEGKRTTLVALALSQATPIAAAELSKLIGADLSAEQLDRGREIIEDSGARAATEQRITTEYDRALEALAQAELTDIGRTALTRLAEISVRRDS